MQCGTGVGRTRKVGDVKKKGRCPSSSFFRVCSFTCFFFQCLRELLASDKGGPGAEVGVAHTGARVPASGGLPALVDREVAVVVVTSGDVVKELLFFLRMEMGDCNFFYIIFFLS